MTQPDANIEQGRDGGLRPGDEHAEPDNPDIQAALAALEDDDDDA